MKHFSLLALLASIMLPTLAQADHHLVFVSAIAKLSDTDCAIELTISGDDQDAFVAEDFIDLDGNEVATFESVMDAINAEDGNNDTGDTILFGSVEFDESHDGLNVDVAFENSICADLDDSSVVAFFNDTTTEIDQIDIGDVDGFTDDTAITKASTSATPEFVDLGDDTVTLTNNAGDAAILGTEATTATSASSCSLAQAPVSEVSGIGLVFVAAALFLVIKKLTIARTMN